jgi:hypothetical protein
VGRGVLVQVPSSGEKRTRLRSTLNDIGDGLSTGRRIAAARWSHGRHRQATGDAVCGLWAVGCGLWAVGCDPRALPVGIDQRASSGRVPLQGPLAMYPATSNKQQVTSNSARGQSFVRAAGVASPWVRGVRWAVCIASSKHGGRRRVAVQSTQAASTPLHGPSRHGWRR